MHTWKKAAALVLAGVMSAGILAGCGSTSTKLDGSETLLTVNDESVDVGVGSFYAKFQQAQMYTYWGSYFGQNGMFDTVTDDESGKSYGEQLKDSVISDLTKMILLSQHASEYNVALTDEQKTAISEAAQAYIDANDQETLDKIGATKEDVERLMTLQTIQSLMMDPIVADVEVQQSSVTYVQVEVKQDEENADAAEDAEASEDAENADAAEEDAAAEDAENADAAEEDAAAEDAENADAAEEEAEPAASADAVDAAKADAQAILDKVLAAEDPATADVSALAKEVNEDYSASTGSFTVSDHTDTTLDAAVVEAVADLKDGEVVKEPVISDDGQSFYVVRMDKVFDEDATENERKSRIIDAKQDKYNEVTDGWVEEAKDKTEEEVEEDAAVEETAEETAEAAEDTAEAAEATAEETTEAAEETAEAAEATAEEATEDAQG